MLSPLSAEWTRRTLTPVIMGRYFEDFDQVSDRPLNPAHDVSENEDHYMVSIDMPGVKKEDIKIELQKNQLLVHGERHRDKVKFEKTFSLSTSVDCEKIEAQYENGVLNIALPKVELAKPRTIEIKTGHEGFFKKLLNSHSH